MPSQIDPTRLADGQPVRKADLRAALSTAKTELEHGGFSRVAATGAVERKVNKKLGEWLSVKDFGAKGDGVTDDTLTLNKAFAHAAQNRRKVFIPSGRYKISDTLWVTPLGSTFKSASIEGAGSGYWDDAAQSLIDATAITDRPALAIYNARGVHISNLLIQGANVAPEAIATPDMAYDAAWVSSGLRDSRYSPYCGIAIDAGCNAVPPDGGYPKIAYTGAPAGSHGLVLDHVAIRRFVVGLAIGINTTTNSDTIELRSCELLGHKVAVSVAHSQVRGVCFVGGNVSICRTCADGMEYGSQNGSSVQMYSTQIGPAFEIFTFQQGVAPVALFGVRAESVHRIGVVGAQTARYPTTLFGCDIHLLHDSIQKAPGVLFYGGNAFKMIGGSLMYNDAPHNALPIVSSSVEFDSVMLKVRDRRKLAVSSFQADAWVSLRNCAIVDSTGQIEIGKLGRYQNLPTRLRLTDHQHIVATRQALYKVINGHGESYFASPVANWTYNGAEIAFDASDPALFQLGDLLYWRTKIPFHAHTFGSQWVQALEIVGILGSRVTTRKLYRDSIYEPAADGYARIHVNEWAPGISLVGDLTSGSVTIANCTAATGVLEVGDFVKAPSGLLSGTRVVAIDGGAITVNKPATISLAQSPLFWGELVPL